ncbi:MAG: Tol-Pal system protein TolB [Rubrivivax sp.]|nr:Tol-Pal system protein TolB [Rubrivivax sp.]
MWTRRQFGAALGGAATAAALPAQAQFRVEISGVGATQLPIAIAPFRGEGAGNAATSAIVRADLERSGVFKSSTPASALDERSPLPQAELRAAGADALLAGSAMRLADGSFDIRYRLWDVVRNREHLARTLSVPAADLRLAAHRIADEVFEKLTGDRGIFATRIAYVTKSARQFVLHVADADGEGGRVALTSNEPIISPAWSPDGRELAYVSFETQRAVVWVQDLQSGRRSTVANFPGTNSAPAWAPTGGQLAVTLSRDGPAQLYMVSREGGNPRRLTVSSAIDTEPVFTPDGRQIYFVSDRGGGPQIYRMGLDGSSPERVTFAGSYNISPAISPDGKTLAYVTRQGGAFRVTTLELASGTLRTLSDTQHDESPSFAPNGRLLVYASRDGGRDVLMTSTLDGRIKTTLLSSGLDMREPAWGPFGR